MDDHMQFPTMTQELAIRIENAEAASWVSRLTAVQRLDGNPLGVEIRQVNGVTALMVRKHQHPELQRVLGLSSVHEAIVDDLLGWYRGYDVNCRLDITPFHASKELLHHLTRRGLFQSGFSTVFYGVPTIDRSSLPSQIAVQELASNELGVFADVYTAHLPGADRAFWRDVTKAEFGKWRCYLASVEDNPAGVAALHIDDGIAYLAAAVTLPEFRRQGCQSALLRRRIADAAAAKYELVVTRAAAGSESQWNIERVGLRVAYTKAVWTVDNA